MMEHHGTLQSLLYVKRDQVFLTSSRHDRKTHSIPFEEFFLKTLPVHVHAYTGGANERGRKERGERVRAAAENARIPLKNCL